MFGYKCFQKMSLKPNKIKRKKYKSPLNANQNLKYLRTFFLAKFNLWITRLQKDRKNIILLDISLIATVCYFRQHFILLDLNLKKSELMHLNITILFKLYLFLTLQYKGFTNFLLMYLNIIFTIFHLFFVKLKNIQIIFFIIVKTFISIFTSTLHEKNTAHFLWMLHTHYVSAFMRLQVILR